MLDRFRRATVFIVSLVSCVVLSLPAAAQETTVRDPKTLAKRLLGVDIPFIILDPTPIYQPGATFEFRVNKKSSPTPAPITATLAGAAPGVYVWVEEGVPFNPDQMGVLVQNFAALLNAVRSFDGLGRLEGMDPLLSIPDVDNDPSLHILYAADVDDNRDVFYNPNNSLAAPYVPGGYSDQREVLVVNVSKYPDVPITDPFFVVVMTRAFYRFVSDFHVPDQALWLKEGLSQMFINGLLQGDSQAAIEAFLQAPNTPFNRLPTLTTAAQTQGAQQLFLAYVQQRLGERTFRELFRQPGEGLSAIDAVLARHNLVDPVTAEPVTARDLFADFVMANVLNLPFGDRRYMYTTEDGLQQGQSVSITNGIGDFSQVQQQVETGAQAVSQFGTYYGFISTSANLNLTLSFLGAPTVNRLPLPARTERFNNFYWSGRGRSRDNLLTRAFDLRGVSSATLTFDAWYDLADQWNYAYVEVSADRGKTWDILRATSTTGDNRSGLAFGPGFTGISNPEGPRPAPFLGIQFDADGTVTDIVPGSPVAGTEMRVGDVIIGYDGQIWPGGQVNLFGLLANYRPGDTLNLYVQRGARRFDVPVVLGEHPVRVILPEPLWLAQTVNLSRYAGKEILLRFEYISLPDQDNNGIVIDNIAIPEIGFSDDAESDDSGWTLSGWQRTSNPIPQRFLLQVLTLDPNGSPTSVQRLIGPSDDITSGQWRFPLPANASLIFAVSGLNDNTELPAVFNLVFGKQS